MAQPSRAARAEGVAILSSGRSPSGSGPVRVAVGVTPDGVIGVTVLITPVGVAWPPAIGIVTPVATASPAGIAGPGSNATIGTTAE